MNEAGQSLHGGEQGKGRGDDSGLENWKEQDVPRKDQDIPVPSPGWDFDSWLEGNPCANPQTELSHSIQSYWGLLTWGYPD